MKTTREHGAQETAAAFLTVDAGFPAAVQKVLEETILREMPSWGPVGGTAVEDVDSTGDAVLRVKIACKKQGDISEYLAIIRHVRAGLAPLGEDRFPLVSLTGAPRQRKTKQVCA